MADLKLVQGSDKYWDLDWDAEAGDLVITDALENSVLISIMTVARAEPSDVLPDNTDRRRGWFGDAYLENPEDTTGSRLWILSRSKLTAKILPQVRQLFAECLEWMVQDGVATSVRVQVAIYTSEIVAVLIQITEPETGAEVFEFFYNWEAQKLARDFEEVA